MASATVLYESADQVLDIISEIKALEVNRDLRVGVYIGAWQESRELRSLESQAVLSLGYAITGDDTVARGKELQEAIKQR